LAFLRFFGCGYWHVVDPLTTSGCIGILAAFLETGHDWVLYGLWPLPKRLRELVMPSTCERPVGTIPARKPARHWGFCSLQTRIVGLSLSLATTNPLTKE
jgi:hypothetical protein